VAARRLRARPRRPPSGWPLPFPEIEIVSPRRESILRLRRQPRSRHARTPRLLLLNPDHRARARRHRRPLIEGWIAGPEAAGRVPCSSARTALRSTAGSCGGCRVRSGSPPAAAGPAQVPRPGAGRAVDRWSSRQRGPGWWRRTVVERARRPRRELRAGMVGGPSTSAPACAGSAASAVRPAPASAVVPAPALHTVGRLQPGTALPTRSSSSPTDRHLLHYAERHHPSSLVSSASACGLSLGPARPGEAIAPVRTLPCLRSSSTRWLLSSDTRKSRSPNP